MNRAERRNRTEKIAKNRFRQLYCGYHGTPERWFYRVYDKVEQARKIGQCRDRVYPWRCRCEYCMGGIQKRQDIADLNFYDQYKETIDKIGKIQTPEPVVGDCSSTGPYDGGHELNDIFKNPVPRSWNMGNRFHH